MNEEEVDPVTIHFLLQIFWPEREETTRKKWFSSFKNRLKFTFEEKSPYKKGEALIEHASDLTHPLNFIKIIIDLYYKWVIKIINLN